MISLTKALAVYLLHAVQVALLKSSYALLWPFLRHKQPCGVVVCPEEIASSLANIGAALSPSVTVSLFSHPFYDYHYDYDLSRRRFSKWFIAPCLLAYLSFTHRAFVYVGGRGFLASRDGRAAEFRFLKSRARTIACYFTGTDIRSRAMLDEYGRRHDIDVLTTYQKYSAPEAVSASSEARRKSLAMVAEKYADVIFNPRMDQMSYLTRDTEPFLYFYPDEHVRRRPAKWALVRRPVIVHAPSSPLIKGTPLVRAAIKRLREESFDFEYVELVGRPHHEVLAALERAHIVLNQFYAFVPGVFGVEAMAANAVLLTSADRGIEPSLFPGANDAWVVTPYWLVYERLRHALSHPEEMQRQADAGTSWAAQYCTQSFGAEYMRRCLNV